MSSGSSVVQWGLELAARALDAPADKGALAQTGEFNPPELEPAEAGVSEAAEKEPTPLAELRADRALLTTAKADLAKERSNRSRAVAVYRTNLETLKPPRKGGSGAGQEPLRMTGTSP